MTDEQRKKLLKMRGRVQKKLLSMELKLKDKAVDKPNATMMQKVTRAAGNSLIDVSRALNRANPAYSTLQRQLNKIDDKLDVDYK